MLDPNLILDTVVAALQSIPALVQQLYNNPANISAHYFYGSTDDALNVAIDKIKDGGILLCYEAMMGGQFSQQCMWKHKVEVYIRPANAAIPLPNGSPVVMSAPQLWRCMLHSPVPVLGNQLLLNSSLLAGSLLPMDVPSAMHRRDDQGFDYWVGAIVWPEYGDQP